MTASGPALVTNTGPGSLPLAAMQCCTVRYDCDVILPAELIAQHADGICRYSIAAGIAHHLIPVIRTGMDAWPAELQLAPQQTRTLYMQSADVLRASKVALKLVQQTRTGCILTCQLFCAGGRAAY
jgi:hypothetical protein